MRKNLTIALVAVAVSILALATYSYAGCGACGTHDHKTSVETAAQAKQEMTIVETAVAAGSFNTLVTAVKAADLTKTLSGEGPFTVFAPTDEAFAKLPKGTVDKLLKDPKKLAAILTYHVVPGTVQASDVIKLKEAKTVQGGSLAIMTNDEGVRVDDANIVQTDIVCSNGVIHVIDEVLMPN